MALGLLGGCLALAGICWGMVGRMDSAFMARSEAKAFGSLQQAAASLVDETGDLLSALDELNRLTSLAMRLEDAGDAVGQLATIQALESAMRHIRPGPSALEVRGPSGHVLMHVGAEPGGGPMGQTVQGLSQAWRTDVGALAEHYLMPLEDRPGTTLRITFDPIAFSQSIANALPAGLSSEAPLVLSLVRLADGVIVVRSPQPALLLDPTPRLSGEPLSQMRETESGVRRFVSPISGQDTMMAFERLPRLGLAAVVSSRTADMLEMANLQMQQYRRAPVVVLFASLAASALWVTLIARARVRRVVEDRQRGADATAAARAELEYLVNCSPALLYRGKLDRDGVYSRDFVTSNAKAITGWEPEMLSDPERVWRLSSEEDRHLRGTNYARALREGRAAVEYRFLRPDGGFSWLRNEAVVTRRNPDGSAEVAGAITNVTREREIAAFAAMQNRMATLGQIATSVAHELTQPMTVIGMAGAIALALADEEAVSTDLRAQLRSIVAQTERAGEMIHHLRSYGHADGGPLTAVSLQQALDGALTLAGTPLRDSGVAITVDLPAGLPMVRGRLVQIEQIMVNLLINARDAMQSIPSGLRQVRIWAGADDMVRLYVADTGPGVPPEAMPRLFEAFYTTKPPGEGTGLGLALCETMMRSFGGTISVGDVPAQDMPTLGDGVGAVFILSFLPMSTSAKSDVSRANGAHVGPEMAHRG